MQRKGYLSDDTIVFWEQEGEARVEIDGEVVFADAMTEERRVEVLKSNKKGDPDANRYDFATEPCDSVDQDCTGDDDATADITCGAGTVLKDDVCMPEKLDDDDDGDSVPAEDDMAAVNEESAPVTEGSVEMLGAEDVSDTVDAEDTKATDYNSSRSNKNSNN